MLISLSCLLHLDYDHFIPFLLLKCCPLLSANHLTDVLYNGANLNWTDFAPRGYMAMPSGIFGCHS